MFLLDLGVVMANYVCLYLKVQSFRLIRENNFIQMTASAGHAVAYMCAAAFPQWLHEYCPLMHQLPLACRF